MVTEFRDLTSDARNESMTDLKYYHTKQWSASELAVLRKRKQPDSTYNWIKVAINGSLGVLKQGETAPEAYGRGEEDQDAAEVATKVLRYVRDLNRFKKHRIERARDYLVQGTCAMHVTIDERGRPKFETVRWEEFIHDPRSRDSDFSDARYKGIAKWMYAADVKLMYPDAASDIDNALSSAAPVPIDDAMEDRPHNGRGAWMDRRNARLMVVDLYYQEGGKWMRAVFFAGALLENGVSPYLDADGKPSCPIEAESCYIDEDNNRYGAVRDMRSPQDGINKRASKLLHLANNRQMRATDSAYEGDADTIRGEAARPDGVIPFGWEPVSTVDMSRGQAELLAGDTQFIERLSPNPAVLGRMNQDASGRSKLVQQQAGLTEQAVMLGSFEDWELRVYQQAWARCKQAWKAPDFVRVTGDEKAAEYIGINQPEYGPAQIGMHPETGMAMIYRPVLGYKNALAEMNVDIEINAVPNTATLAHEQFMGMMELAQSGVPIPPKILIKASSLPLKRELLEELEEAEQQPNPMAEIQQAGAQAEVEKTQSETMRNVAEAQQTQAMIPINAFKAGHEIGMSGAADQDGRSAANA